MVARRAVDGVIEATREIGGNVDETAKVAIGGAIEAAGAIGNTAVRAVRDVLVGAVEAVKDVASAALPKPPPTHKVGDRERADRQP
jgi:phage-related protein